MLHRVSRGRSWQVRRLFRAPKRRAPRDGIRLVRRTRTWSVSSSTTTGRVASSHREKGSAMSQRRAAPDPYDDMPDVPSMILTSTDISEGDRLGQHFVHTRAGGADASPQLAWLGLPARAQGL